MLRQLDNSFPLWFLLWALPWLAQAQFNTFDDLSNFNQEIKIDGQDLRFDTETGEISYAGPVSISYGEVSIFSDRAFYNTRRRVVRVEGDVTIYQNGFVYRGEEARYNLATERLSSDSLRTYAMTPNGTVFVDAGTIDIDTQSSESFTTSESFLTGHDSANPNWRIDAEQIEVFPEEKIIFKNMVMRVGELPVFWLPRYTQPFDSELGYQFTPGYLGDWGFFLFNRYGILLGEDDHTLLQFRADLRSERGVAGGLDFYSMRWRSQPNFGRFFLYYAQDSDPFIERNLGLRQRAELEEGRYRVNFQHRIYLRGYEDSWEVDPQTGQTRLAAYGEPVDPNWYIDADLNWISDEFFYEDFFPGEARIDPQPDSILNLVRRDPRYEASLLTRFRLTDAFTRDERLPEFSVRAVRQPFTLFGLEKLGLLYQGDAAFGYLKEDVALSRQRQFEAQQAGIRNNIAFNGGVANPAQINRLNSLQRRLDGQSFFRADTYHQFSRPFQVADKFQLVPRVGVRATSWNSVETGDDELRLLGHLGLEGSVKFTRRWDNIKNRSLGLDGLMHVFQPYTEWSLVGGDEVGEGFTGIDRLPRTTRARTLDLAQYQALDEINQWNVLRLGAFNHLLTRRDNQTHSWLTYNSFFDIYLDDPEFERDLSNWYHEISWRPLPWLSLNLDGQIPLTSDDQAFTEWNTGFTWMPRDWVEISLSHRYLDESPFFQNSNQFTLRSYIRLNEDWGVSTAHRYEVDDGTLESQEYGVYRDLETWTTGLQLLTRDNRDETEVGLLFNLTLKQFPQASLPLSLLPGNGD